MKSFILLLLLTTVHAQKGQNVVQELNAGQSPPLSAAMKSVLMMAVVFFIIEVATFIYKAYMEVEKMKMDISRQDSERRPVEKERYLDNVRDFLQSMDIVTKQIPVLIVLILFAQFRFEVVLERTEVPDYAANTFYAIAWLIIIQGAVLFLDTCQNSTLKVINLFVAGAAKLSILVCVIIVIESIFSTKKIIATISD